MLQLRGQGSLDIGKCQIGIYHFGHEIQAPLHLFQKDEDYLFGSLLYSSHSRRHLKCAQSFDPFVIPLLYIQSTSVKISEHLYLQKTDQVQSQDLDSQLPFSHSDLMTEILIAATNNTPEYNMFEELSTQLIQLRSDYVVTDGRHFALLEDGPPIYVGYFVLSLLDVDGVFALVGARLVVDYLDQVLAQLALADLFPRLCIFVVGLDDGGRLSFDWEGRWFVAFRHLGDLFGFDFILERILAFERHKNRKCHSH